MSIEIPSAATIASEMARYLRTGSTDPKYAAWPGSFMQRVHRAHEDLRGALVRDVHRLAAGREQRPMPAADTLAITRSKVEPMVRGLFPRAEQDVVLAMLEKSVVFVTTSNVETLLRTKSFDHSAWTIANLYLASVGDDLLDADAPRLVGLSEGTTCYVTPEVFDEQGPFADFIVHEAAHVFHNCKRRSIGLRETRARAWLLDVDFGSRETFAYSCEAFARIVATAENRAHRVELAAEYGRVVRISDDRVDPREVASIVAEAAEARSGWKAILERCAPVERSRLVSRDLLGEPTSQ